MNWFKKSVREAPRVDIIYFDSYGNLKVLINGKEYRYFEVSPYQKEMLEKYIKVKNWGSVFKLIRSLKQEKK